MCIGERKRYQSLADEEYEWDEKLAGEEEWEGRTARMVGMLTDGKNVLVSWTFGEARRGKPSL